MNRSPLETAPFIVNLPGMTTELAAQITKLTKRQKLHLADQLLAEAGAHKKPTTIRSSDDPVLETEVRRRLSDRSPGAWLSLDTFVVAVALRAPAINHPPLHFGL